MKILVAGLSWLLCVFPFLPPFCIPSLPPILDRRERRLGGKGGFKIIRLLPADLSSSSGYLQQANKQPTTSKQQLPGAEASGAAGGETGGTG